MIWYVAGAIVIGFILGYVFARHKFATIVGTVRVDQSDPYESPYLFLELEHDGLNTIQKSKIVSFNVKVENFVGSTRN